METIRAAVNGFGRMGRALTRLSEEEQSDVSVVAINDLGDARVFATLLGHDSTHGTFRKSVKHIREGDQDFIVVGGRPIPFFHEKEPEKLPWERLGIDIAYESTGCFRTIESAGKHLRAGARKVAVSSTVKGLKPYVMGGVPNETALLQQILAIASCSTNNAAPLNRIIDRLFGIRALLQKTTHAYTLGEQQLLDNGVGDDPRKARAAPENIVPATSNATQITREEYPQADPDGDSTRVPVSNVSRGEYTYLLGKPTSVAEINELVAKAIDEELKQAGIYDWTDEPLVSSDYNGRTESGVFDRTLTLLSGNVLAELRAWYDNESGVSQRMLQVTPKFLKAA